MFTITDILKSTGASVIGKPAKDDVVFTKASIDSRAIAGCELFVPLRGKHKDGHDYIGIAMENGALGTFVERNVQLPAGFKSLGFVVDDNLRALQLLASHLRHMSKIPVIGITGTNGKTTSKEMTAAVLSKKYKVLKTEGNYNNHIGMPLMLTCLAAHDVSVLEMGASLKRDIATLCDIATPTIGVITNIGAGHLEGFGSIYDVRNTKLEIMDYVDTLIVNGDDAFLMEGVNNKKVERNVQVITYSMKDKGDFNAKLLESFEAENHMRAIISVSDGETQEIELNVLGTFNVYNALSAFIIGYTLGISIGDVAEALSTFRGVGMRMELTNYNGATVIKDLYNANPMSMMAAVRELNRVGRARKIAILGDMLELGDFSKEEHSKLGFLAYETGVDVFVAVGDLMENAAIEFSKVTALRGNRRDVFRAANAVEASIIFKDIVKKGDTVLIKGSRGLKMERILE
ncbi:MAG: UDP-N-acetylmuramoyl-tripeptide--D-alanyl-D-alanine ligase [Candidatus Magnetoovum sp. WYHC-5]|nr:UDP-N-acetylmuramoyl-tripeptide--D-alanyl-D-alanine ligase [Candidatus Magnetoovum sp. WYHC-5]